MIKIITTLFLIFTLLICVIKLVDMIRRLYNITHDNDITAVKSKLERR